MEASSSPQPIIGLSALVCRQLVYTLTGLLPPPLDDTPTALRARNHAAIAKVAALLPVNPNEADLAAQWVAAQWVAAQWVAAQWVAAKCIAARAQSEEMLRLRRQYAGDLGWVMRLNAQYGSMVRTSLSVHGRLMRVQAVRQKREAIDSAANADAQALHATERSMLIVVDPNAGALKAAPIAAPVEAPAVCVDPRIAENVSDSEANSQDAAFETGLSAQPGNHGSKALGKTSLRENLRAAMEFSRLSRREVPANGRESPGRAA